MISKHPQIVFLTDFSPTCHLAIPSVSRMVQDLGAQLAILHAHTTDVDPAKAREQLGAFFSEADRLTTTQRILYRGSLLDALRESASLRAVDLFVAPGAPRSFFSWASPSQRAMMVASSPAPVLTTIPPLEASRRIRRIACWLDPHARDQSYLRRAARLATEVSGSLHVFHIVPDFFEGEIVTARTPLCSDEVADAIRRALGTHLHPEVHVSPGGAANAALQMARACDPDLVILSARDSLRRGLRGPRLSQVAERAGCPVLCFGPEVGTRVAPPHHAASPGDVVVPPLHS